MFIDLYRILFKFNIVHTLCHCFVDKISVIAVLKRWYLNCFIILHTTGDRIFTSRHDILCSLLHVQPKNKTLSRKKVLEGVPHTCALFAVNVHNVFT